MSCFLSSGKFLWWTAADSTSHRQRTPRVLHDLGTESEGGPWQGRLADRDSPITAVDASATIPRPIISRHESRRFGSQNGANQRGPCRGLTEPGTLSWLQIRTALCNVTRTGTMAQTKQTGPTPWFRRRSFVHPHWQYCTCAAGHMERHTSSLRRDGFISRAETSCDTFLLSVEAILPANLTIDQGLHACIRGPCHWLVLWDQERPDATRPRLDPQQDKAPTRLE